MIRTAVFPVAGLGTRILPLTKALPKEMLPVLDKPLIQYAVEEAQKAGIEKFIFISSPTKTIIQDHFDYQPLLEQTLERKNKEQQLDSVRACSIPPGNAIFIRQGAPLGLGHAILMAKECIQDEKAFAILSPDDFLEDTHFLKKMIDAYINIDHPNKRPIMAAVRHVGREETKHYGVLDIDDQSNDLITAKGLVEKPDPATAPSDLAIIGRYIVPTPIFDILENQNPTQGGEIQLTDAFQRGLDSGDLSFYGLLYEKQLFDCGQLPGWIAANTWMATERGLLS